MSPEPKLDPTPKPLLSHHARAAMVPTQRQIEVLRAYALNDGNWQEVADSLGIGRQTVKNHTSDLYRRLGVHSATDAMRRLGWLKVPE